MDNGVSALGRGLVAGAVGTAAQTLSQKVEQSKTHREDSMVPAEVGAAVFKPSLSNGADAKQLGLGVHWGHGITMGAMRGALALTPLKPLTASAAHFVLMWTGDALLYKGLKVAPWPHKWGGKALATDLGHKFVLSAVTSAAFLTLIRARK